MGYISIGAYESRVSVPEFRGVLQAGTGLTTDPRYCTEMENANTKEGRLRPFAQSEVLPATLNKPIETLAVLYRRWYVYEESKGVVLIAASNHQLYWGLDGQSWNILPLPTDWQGDGYESSRWSYVSYEINPDPDAVDAPIDVLLMSNAKDGMIMIRGDNMTVHKVLTPEKFGIITRHAERIWGGAIDDNPDKLMYSAPYDPTNWEANYEIPEDGAGDIMQPSWDGDSFQSLCNLGTSLIAFKKDKVWRVYGTDPGEYQFSEQYGVGTPCPGTIVPYRGMIYMMGMDGLYVYNGESVNEFRQDYLVNIWKGFNWAYPKKACACIHKGVYYLSMPYKSYDNSLLVMYDLHEDAWRIRTDIHVNSFLHTREELYFTTVEEPGRICKWHDDCMEEGRTAVPMKWTSGWFDLGYKNMTKGSFTIYLTIECKEETELRFSIQTEKKTKTKTVKFQPPKEGKGAQQKRLQFGGNGRRFRFSIESDAGNPWQMIGGMEIRLETDED